MEMNEIPTSDREFSESTIDKVEDHKGEYSITDANGWSLGIGKPGFVPQVGEVVRYYGQGIGRPVRGVCIGGKVVRYQSPAEHEAEMEEKRAAYKLERQRRLAETKIPDVVTPGFEWTEDMADISGMGGGYERACRQMISQGCAWWAEHPEANPRFQGFTGVYGICLEDNDDAKALSKAICGDIDPSGAMHQAAVSHVFHWRKLGSWLAYQTSMRDLAREREML